MHHEKRKQLGAFYTPDPVVQSLVRWAVKRETDQLLDPACGDGRFLAAHRKTVGVEQDESAVAMARVRAPWALIHEGDFFTWASKTNKRFDCAAGNPPFIRYQRFSGDVRQLALKLCGELGAGFSALTSSWAPFLVATASLLKPGGRMAFVVPSEIGHAPYARPLLSYLLRHFAEVRLTAVRKKLFTELSEDAWLLYADGFGRETDHFILTPVDRFTFSPDPPRNGVRVGVVEWSRWNFRLRPFLLSDRVRSVYRSIADLPSTTRLGQVAKVGIGYVTGANDFFHLSPSASRRAGIPRAFLHPAVRNARSLTSRMITNATVKAWEKRDKAMLLLRLNPQDKLPASVLEYLNRPEGIEARQTYKCRNRKPWYVVPDVTVPDGFLTYMSGDRPWIVANRARCVCTNSLHALHLKGPASITQLQAAWDDPFTSLSCELEGHPLGGGILKLEPGEAGRVCLTFGRKWSVDQRILIEDGMRVMREWRHVQTAASDQESH